MKLHNPRTSEALTAILDRTGTLFDDHAPKELCTLCRQLEDETEALRASESENVTVINLLRQKLENQAKRIRELEGATNHAGGLMNGKRVFFTQAGREMVAENGLLKAGMNLAAELCRWAPREERAEVLRQWDDVAEPLRAKRAALRSNNEAHTRPSKT